MNDRIDSLKGFTNLEKELLRAVLTEDTRSLNKVSALLAQKAERSNTEHGYFDAMWAEEAITKRLLSQLDAK